MTEIEKARIELEAIRDFCLEVSAALETCYQNLQKRRVADDHLRASFEPLYLLGFSPGLGLELAR